MDINKEYDEVKKLLEDQKNESQAISMARYMKNKFLFYGIPASKRKEVYKGILKREKNQKRINWELLDKCYQDEYREMQYFVCDYLRMMQKYIGFEDISNIQKYIQTKSWWDSVDCFNQILGNMAFKDKRVKEIMLLWAEDEEMWLRRVAINHQLGKKEKTDSVLLEIILVKNLNSSEFFINKAIGWSLRDYSKTNPAWVRDFLARYDDGLANLSKKEASKYI